MLLALAVLTWVTMMLGLVAERVLAVEEVGKGMKRYVGHGESLVRPHTH
jgi:hypothetical protein